MFDEARAALARLLGVHESGVIFTSGGTESANLAIKRMALAEPRGSHILVSAIKGSSFVVIARGPQGQLWGLARAISDDATICFVHDILVHRETQRAGVRRALLEHVQARYEHVRQTVLYHG